MITKLVHFIICPICNKWKDLERECGHCADMVITEETSECVWKYICKEWETNGCKCNNSVIISYLISKLMEENIY